MTIEYVLLLVCMFFFGIKAMLSAPTKAFKDSGPMLGARIEQQLATGDGFKPGGNNLRWEDGK
jgi:hypothetical protein